MRYKVAYIIKDGDADKKHHRYYCALNEETALSMFDASKEESMIGEDPEIDAVYVNTAEDGKRYNWEKTDEAKEEEV